jgi:hypothetical protein
VPLSNWNKLFSSIEFPAAALRSFHRHGDGRIKAPPVAGLDTRHYVAGGCAALSDSPPRRWCPICATTSSTVRSMLPNIAHTNLLGIPTHSASYKLVTDVGVQELTCLTKLTKLTKHRTSVAQPSPSLPVTIMYRP